MTFEGWYKKEHKMRPELLELVKQTDVYEAMREAFKAGYQQHIEDYKTVKELNEG